MMRVKREISREIPEEYWSEEADCRPIVTKYAGEVIGVVRSFGTTNLVVARDDGKIVEVIASSAEKDFR